VPVQGRLLLLLDGRLGLALSPRAAKLQTPGGSGLFRGLARLLLAVSAQIDDI